MKPAGPQRFGPLLDDWRSLASRFNASDAVFRRLEEHQRRPATPLPVSRRMLYAALGWRLVCIHCSSVIVLDRRTPLHERKFPRRHAGRQRRACHVDRRAILSPSQSRGRTENGNNATLEPNRWSGPCDDQNETKIFTF